MAFAIQPHNKIVIVIPNRLQRRNAASNGDARKPRNHFDQVKMDRKLDLVRSSSSWAWYTEKKMRHSKPSIKSTKVLTNRTSAFQTKLTTESGSVDDMATRMSARNSFSRNSAYRAFETKGSVPNHISPNSEIHVPYMSRK